MNIISSTITFNVPTFSKEDSELYACVLQRIWKLKFDVDPIISLVRHSQRLSNYYESLMALRMISCNNGRKLVEPENKDLIYRIKDDLYEFLTFFPEDEKEPEIVEFLKALHKLS